MKTSAVKLGIIGLIATFLLTIPIKNLGIMLKLTITYFLFIYLPFLNLIDKIKIGIVEKFLLTNIAGLTYGAIFVVLDVIFKIPLTKAIFIIVTGLIIMLSYVVSSKDINIL